MFLKIIWGRVMFQNNSVWSKFRVAIHAGKPGLSPVFDLMYGCLENKSRDTICSGFGKTLKNFNFKNFFE